MYTNDHKNTGLGSAALRYFLDVFGGPLYVSANDGMERDDGSHLTEDAPSFVQHMIAIGVIAGYESRLSNNEDDINGFF
jgi:hypothetical protein